MAALRSPRLWRCEALGHDSAHPISLLWDSGLEKVQTTPFEVPQSPAAVPHRRDLNEVEHCRQRSRLVTTDEHRALLDVGPLLAALISAQRKLIFTSEQH